MSDHIDTEAVRRAWPITEDTQHGSPVAWMNALCDEVDRLRAALLIAAEQCVSTTDPDEVPWLIDRWMARAALAEGNTERPKRCPTCGSDDPKRLLPQCQYHYQTTRYDNEPDPWHRTTDTERCPTCGSDDPAVRNLVVVERAQHGHIERRCSDAFHRPAPLVEGEQG